MVRVRVRFSVWLVNGYAHVFYTTFRCHCNSPVIEPQLSGLRVPWISVPAMAPSEASKPDEAAKTSLRPAVNHSRTQLQLILSRAHLDAQLWLNCRLALAKSLLLRPAGQLCSSDG